jgi:hypothetical protein
LKNKPVVFLLTMVGVSPTFSAMMPVTPVPDKVACMVPDRQAFQEPDCVHLSGWLGTRIAANEVNRLVKIDPARLLEGYRKRPGRQAWDGEHVGKWLHAATLAWVYTGDPALRQKLDYVAAELVKCQLADGYLGTYLEKDRWTEWDVWAHKYNLIGLIAYMRWTGNLEPLPACRRMAELLCRTFGDAPGKSDIIAAGHHVGMAPTSVLEPMVLLYRFTGEPRYLDFCSYILRAWEQPNGPKILSTLLTQKRVDKVGNGKAYEMLSCLNGALEYYRTVGDHKILEACLNAWQDIVDHRLYITGAASYEERFHDDFDLPNANNVGETCVTVTWLQFNAQLLRLTGEARFAEQLEHVILNQLLGAQRPDGCAWGYYVEMEGRKPYSDTLDGHCCLSSGPRGIALIPTFTTSTDADGAVMNLYDAGTARLSLADQTAVTLVTDTLYPSDDRIRVTVDPAVNRSFALKVRMPAWCRAPLIRVNGKQVPAQAAADGYVAIKREWRKGDMVELEFEREPRVIVGDHMNQGKVAVAYGPLVLAADAALLGNELTFTPSLSHRMGEGVRRTGEGGSYPMGEGRGEGRVEGGGGPSLDLVALAGPDLSTLDIQPATAPAELKTWAGSQVFRINAVAREATNSIPAGAPLRIQLIPFADAGASGEPYQVWLPLPQASGD